MKITHIGVDGIKGRTVGLDLSERCLLVTGPMGSGKSALLDGIRLALGVPTEHGTRGLERLSPNGTWKTSVEFDGGPVTRLERRCSGGKSQFFVNGAKSDKNEYANACAAMCGVDAHHADISAFLGLSGQKRAALFSKILEDGGDESVETALGKAIGSWLSDVSDAPMEVLDGIVRRLRVIKGSPAHVAAAVREAVNDLTTTERDARTRLDGLISEQTNLTHGASTEGLKRQIGEIDERIGGFKARREKIESEKERYDAATRVLEQARTNESKSQQELTTALERIEGKDKLASDTAEAEEKAQSAEAAIDAFDETHRKLEEQRKTLEGTKAGLTRSLSLVRNIVDAEWSIDDEWLDEEWAELGGRLEADLPETDDDRRKIIVEFAREVVLESMGGNVEKIESEIAEVETKISSVASDIRSSEETLQQSQADVAKLQEAATKLRTELKAVEDLESSIPELRQAVEDAAKKRAELESSVQQSSATESDDTLAAQIATAEGEKATLQEQLRELERHSALAGQVERGRLDLAKDEARLHAAKRIDEVVQTWRNTSTQERLSALLGPFDEAVAKVFGSGMSLAHNLEGTGRSTTFDFEAVRNGVKVPIDLLSDGETTLMAMAFLVALQQIDEVPGTLLTLNTEPLDVRGVGMMLESAPKLGMDLVAVANNRMEGIEVPDGWQVVDMADPPKHGL